MSFSKISALSLVALISGLTIFAGCRHPKGNFSCWKSNPEDKKQYVLEKMTDELDLTEEQSEKVEVLIDEVMAEKQKGREAHRKLKGEFLAQFAADEIDSEVLDEMAAEGRTHIDNMLVLLQDKLVELHAILTPEQRAVLVEKVEKHCAEENDGFFDH